MNLRKKFKNTVASYLLERELKDQHRDYRSVSFDEAQRIGILYDATNELDYEMIKRFVKETRAQQKEVLALGFYDRKDLPDTRFVKLGLDFFTRRSLNWHLKPRHPRITNFMNAGFDILINLNIEKCFPLKYISAHTRAKFKIGKYDKRNSRICDFMVKTNDDIPVGKLIEQFLHYLKQIKHEQPKDV